MKTASMVSMAVVLTMCFSSCKKPADYYEYKVVEVTIDGTEYYFELQKNHEAKITHCEKYYQGGHDCYSGHVEIPDSITYKKIVYCVVGIGQDAFYGCENLHWVRIPNTVTFIEERAFGDCENLTTVEIPNTVTSLPSYVFDGCGFSSFDIPNSITSIGRQAFSFCKNLKSVIIPESILSLDGNAFHRCGKLSSVTCLAPTPPLFMNGVFDGCPIQAIKVPAESVDSYKSAEGWKNYADLIAGI